MDRQEIKDFCKDFAYRFISSECMMKEFKRLTCGDAQEIKEHLENTLDLDLQDFLEEQGLISD